jgi:hypothetical protein
MPKLIIEIQGCPEKFEIDSPLDQIFPIKISDEQGNIIRSIEYVDGEMLSVEGSDSRKHFNNPKKWLEYPGRPTQFRFKKSASYNKSVDDLGLHTNQIIADEKKLFDHLTNILNSGNIHGFVHRYRYNNNRNEVRLSECDFGGRDYGRLLYWVDLEPACVYFGYLLKRNDKNYDGHISEGLGDDVAKSVLEAKERLIMEIRREEENVARGNRGR